MWYPIALLHVGARLSWTAFTVHPSTVIGLAALGALYAWRWRVALSPRAANEMSAGAANEMSPRAERGGAVHPGKTKPILFASGLLLMFFSLNGWLHDLSDSYLFTAHMVQHLLLAMGVAPLLIMGTPGWMLRPLLRFPMIAGPARWMTNPIVAFGIFNVVLIGWHLPPLYNAAMAHHSLHIVQHLLLLAASVIMWWPVLSPLPELPRLSYPGQMLYLFLMTIPMSLISVSIAYAGSILYPIYAAAPRVTHLSPMEDQMLGGLTMWIPGGLYFFTIISIIFFRWQQAGGLDSRASAQVDLITAKS
jgi:putative membrane protein